MPLTNIYKTGLLKLTLMIIFYYIILIFAVQSWIWHIWLLSSHNLKKIKHVELDEAALKKVAGGIIGYYCPSHCPGVYG